jgi:hypothetical protein
MCWLCGAANPLLLNQEGAYTVSATAVKHGFYSSEEASIRTDVAWQVLLPPVFSPALKYHFSSVNVSLSTPQDATIYYTIDGSKPSVNSTIYTEPFALTNALTSISSMTVPTAAIGFRESAVLTQLYRILTPQLTTVQPSKGPHSGAAEVLLTLTNTPDQQDAAQFGVAFGSTNGSAHCLAGNQSDVTCASVLLVSSSGCNGYYCEQVTVLVRTPAAATGQVAVDVAMQSSSQVSSFSSSSAYEFEDSIPVVEQGFPEPSQGPLSGGYVLSLRVRYLLAAGKVPDMLEVRFGSLWVQTDAPAADLKDPYVVTFDVLVPTVAASLSAGVTAVPIRVVGATTVSASFNFTFMSDTAPRLDYIQPAEVSAIGGSIITLGLKYFDVPVGTAVEATYNGQSVNAIVVQNAAAMQVLEFEVRCIV